MPAAAILVTAAALGGGTCQDNQAYWVQPLHECATACGHQGRNLQSYCVPTAAGNLITHLYPDNPEKPGQNYNQNNDIDIRNTNTNEHDWTDKGDQWKTGGGDSTLTYLGGAWHPDPDWSLGNLMGTTPNVGTTVPNARAGLQLYLENTIMLGPSAIVNFSDPSPGQTDFDFLATITPPYMLHIKPKCIHQNMWKRGDGDQGVLNNQPIKNIGEGASDLEESSLGHTITIYSAEEREEWIVERREVDLRIVCRGASGLSATRLPTNERTCDMVGSIFFDTQHCIEGATAITLHPPPTTKDSTDSFPYWPVIGSIVGVVILATIALAYAKWKGSAAAKVGSFEASLL